MKIIHCADLHLGSNLTSLPIKEIKDIRKNELLNSYNRLIEYANNNNIDMILFSGDVFDSDRPSKKDKQFFYSSIKSNPNIRFIYLKGNHDISESLNEEYDNLYLFSDEWKKYEFDDIVISGIELSNNNKSSLYASINLNPDKINIVMMHGDISSRGKEFIDLKKLANKNIDYLALGHIHQSSINKIDDRGIAVYPGCLDGRGFDELDTKGFYVIDTNSIKNPTFIPFSSRIIREINIDITNASSLYDAKEIVNNKLKEFNFKDIIKINLIGNVKFDIDGINDDIYGFIKNNFFYVKVKNELIRTIDYNDFKNDYSLKGEFIRNVLNNNEYDDKKKDEIISIGLKILNGEEML